MEGNSVSTKCIGLIFGAVNFSVFSISAQCECGERVEELDLDHNLCLRWGSSDLFLRLVLVCSIYKSNFQHSVRGFVDALFFEVSEKSLNVSS